MNHGFRGPPSPPDVRELLSGAGGQRIFRRLAGYATSRVRNIEWRTRLNLDLAKGLDPEDIAAEAIFRLLSGQRRWDPTRVGLLDFLCGIVDGQVSHLKASLDNRVLTRFPHGEEGEELRDRAEYNAALHDIYQWLTQQPVAPERAVIGSDEGSPEEYIERLIATLRQGGDHEAAELLETVCHLGETRPRFLSELCGTSRSHIYNVFKRVRRAAQRLERR